MTRIMMILAAAIAATGGGCSSGARDDLKPQAQAEAEAVRAEVDQQFGGRSEANCKAAAAGYDYVRIVSECLLRRADAMRELFAMAQMAGFDAASADGHASALGFVLRDAGDRFFGECLSAEFAPVQQAVREQLLYDMGYGNTSITAEEIRNLYPKTFPASCRF